MFKFLQKKLIHCTFFSTISYYYIIRSSNHGGVTFLYGRVLLVILLVIASSKMISYMHVVYVEKTCINFEALTQYVFLSFVITSDCTYNLYQYLCHKSCYHYFGIQYIGSNIYIYIYICVSISLMI